jgi:tetratricopeptide (TPR) repeat protein
MGASGLGEGEMLRDGEAAYAGGDLVASARLFAAVAKSGDPVHAGAGFYGLGMIALTRDRGEAQQLFEAAVKKDDRLANGWYQLGRLREEVDPKGATQLFERALAIDPGHRSARQRLPQRVQAPPQPVSPSRQAEPVAADPREGVVANLQQRFEQTLERRTVYVWNFRLDRGDQPPVAVEMRGYGFEGSLANGDRVRLPVIPKSGSVLQVDAVQNISSNATVRVRRQRSTIIRASYVVRFFLLLIFLSVFVAIAFVAATQFASR